MEIAAALVIGFILDMIIGDPQFMYHPIRLIGGLISRTEPFFRRVFGRDGTSLRGAGMLFSLFIMLSVSGLAFILLYGASLINIYAYTVLQAAVCWQMTAAKSLKTETLKVYRALKASDLERSRHEISMLVGRDTDRLDETGIIKACIETIAENISDGVAAPVFFFALGGGAAAVFYKAANTLDSMIGYKNEKYIDFGRFAAKFDDVLNYIPARLSAVLMIAAAWILGFDGRGAARVFRRDRYNHASPNSAQTESVCAGALGIQLAGDAFYFGERYSKPTIGDDLRKPEADDILRAHRILSASSAAAVLLLSSLRALVIFLIMR